MDEKHCYLNELLLPSSMKTDLAEDNQCQGNSRKIQCDDSDILKNEAINECISDNEISEEDFEVILTKQFTNTSYLKHFHCYIWLTDILLN